MKRKTQLDIEHGISFMPDQRFAYFPSSSPSRAFHDSYHEYMSRPHNDTDLFYRGDSYDFGNLFRIAQDTHNAVYKFDPPYARCRLSVVPLRIAYVVGRSIAPCVNEILRLAAVKDARELKIEFEDFVHAVLLPKCEAAHNELIRPSAQEIERKQWRSPNGEPILLNLFTLVVDYWINFVRRTYRSIGLHDRLENFERYITSLNSGDREMDIYTADWLLPDTEGNRRKPIGMRSASSRLLNCSK